MVLNLGEESSMAERKSARAGAGEGNSRFLLVVDSDINELYSLSMLLRHFDYNIFTAKTATEAFEIATTAVPALIIIDANLKGINGIELLSQLRQQPRTAAVPIVIKTANMTPQIERLCFRENASCIRKPVEEDEFFRAVRAALKVRPRKSIRIPTNLPIMINATALNRAKGECVTDLSENGMYIRINSPFPLNTQLRMKIDLNGASIPIGAEVMFRQQKGGDVQKGPGMGVRFTHIAPKDMDLIRQYISNELARGVKPL
jgi:CheY-like chemotaxis protein